MLIFPRPRPWRLRSLAMMFGAAWRRRSNIGLSRLKNGYKLVVKLPCSIDHWLILWGIHCRLIIQSIEHCYHPIDIRTWIFHWKLQVDDQETVAPNWCVLNRENMNWMECVESCVDDPCPDPWNVVQAYIEIPAVDKGSLDQGRPLLCGSMGTPNYEHPSLADLTILIS